MAQIDDISAASDNRSAAQMPKALVVVAAIFLVARLVDMGFSAVRANTTQPVNQSIQWQDFPQLSAVPGTKQEFVPPPVQDVSPESMREIEKMLAESRTKRKYVLYEFYAPWSDPCKKMESTSLSNAQVNGLINEHFIPVRVTDRLKELGKNPRLVTDLQKKYRIFAFPTLVILDSNGELAASLVGNCSSLTTYRFLSRSLFTLEQKHKAQAGKSPRKAERVVTL